MQPFDGPFTEWTCRMIHGDSASTLRVGTRGFWFVRDDWYKFSDIIYLRKNERSHLLKIFSIQKKGEQR